MIIDTSLIIEDELLMLIGDFFDEFKFLAPLELHEIIEERQRVITYIIKNYHETNEMLHKFYLHKNYETDPYLDALNKVIGKRLYDYLEIYYKKIDAYSESFQDQTGQMIKCLAIEYQVFLYHFINEYESFIGFLHQNNDIKELLYR